MRLQGHYWVHLDHPHEAAVTLRRHTTRNAEVRGGPRTARGSVVRKFQRERERGSSVDQPAIARETRWHASTVAALVFRRASRCGAEDIGA